MANFLLTNILLESLLYLYYVMKMEIFLFHFKTLIPAWRQYQYLLHFQTTNKVCYLCKFVGVQSFVTLVVLNLMSEVNEIQNALGVQWKIKTLLSAFIWAWAFVLKGCSLKKVPFCSRMVTFSLQSEHKFNWKRR